MESRTGSKAEAPEEMKHWNSRSKYGNQKAAGFDSTKERGRWQELCLMQKAGKISNLQRQVEYELIPRQKEPDTVGTRGGVIRGKTIEHPAKYIADFTYIDSKGQLVVEDVKGYRGGEAYKLFVLKRKLMLWRWGIRIREV